MDLSYATSLPIMPDTSGLANAEGVWDLIVGALTFFGSLLETAVNGVFTVFETVGTTLATFAFLHNFFPPAVWGGILVILGAVVSLVVWRIVAAFI